MSEASRLFQPILRFAVCSDVHMRSADDERADRLRRFIRGAYAHARDDTAYPSLDVLLFCGDLTDSGTEAQIADFWRVVQEELRPGTQVLSILAKCHDNWEEGRNSPKTGLSYYRSITGLPTSFCTVIGGCAFIGISTSEEDGISARTQTGAEDGIKTGAGPAAAVKEDETEAGTEAENRFLDETETESENVEEWDRESVQDFDPEAPLVGVGAAQNSQQETEEDLSAPDTVDARNTILVSGSSSMGGNSSSVTNRATGVTVTNAGIVLPATLTAPTVPGAENSGLPQETVSSGSSPQASENLPADSSSYGSESGLSSESVLTAPTVQETQAPQTEAPQPTYLTMTGTCYLRSAPDYGDNILGTYQAGTTVLFYGPEEGWYKVEVDGMVGYMGPKFFQ